MSTRLSPEEYLRLEREDEWKNEYIDGEMLEMSHPSIQHLAITMNLASALSNVLRKTPCVVFALRLRVATDPRRYYTYPDVGVLCGAPEFADDQHETITNPTLLAEVLSESTEEDDRGAKFEHYRTIPTFAEYLLVSQDRVHIELYTRQPGGVWALREWNDLAAEIELTSLGCQLAVADVYLNVTFA